jgi:four helix bundle protein
MEQESFEKLVVWQRAIEMAVEIHLEFSKCRDFSFRDQISAAADSVSNNIAEGAERLSKAEFRQFLGYAKGSAGEVRSQLYIAERLAYLSASKAQKMRAELIEISRMLHGLIESLK